MDVYVIGSAAQANQIESKISTANNFQCITSAEQINDQSLPVVFDFNADDSPEILDEYQHLSDVRLFINATRMSLAETVYLNGDFQGNLYGFAADPTFIERDILEVSAHPNNKIQAQQLIKDLGLRATIVDDRVGLVTPRIIAMIINEAFYTVMEGTATSNDIDTAMKLGTNYPLGPFEWSEAWGIANIYELLEALYADTKDERYKICPLLKKRYLNLSYS